MKKITIILLAILASTLSLYSQNETKAAKKATKQEAVKDKTVISYEGMTNVVKNVVYKNYQGKDLGLDIIKPTKQLYKNGSPVIICIHGGGWGGGKRYVMSKADMDRADKLGITLVPISYSKQTILECVTDCFDAARFLAKNAEKYNLDPDRFAISGHSAGGHLCLMLGLGTPELFIGDEALKDEKFTVRCLSAKAPISTLIDDEMIEKYPRVKHRATSTRNLGIPFEGSYELRKKLSPIVYLTKDSPPVQIIHGNVDEACPIEETIKFCNYAKDINPIEFIEVDGAGHGVKDSEPQRKEDFYKKYLLKDIEGL